MIPNDEDRFSFRHEVRSRLVCDASQGLPAADAPEGIDFRGQGTSRDLADDVRVVQDDYGDEPAEQSGQAKSPRASAGMQPRGPVPKCQAEQGNGRRGNPVGLHLGAQGVE